MKLKVCGLKNPDQIMQLDEMEQVDFLGFIFYEQSKRYFNQNPIFTNKSKRVGVFVNKEVNQLIEIARLHKLDYIQLHGDETVFYCRKLMNQLMQQNYKLSIIKAFGINESFDFRNVSEFESLVDYFLFDTKTATYGGSGKNFNWSKLNEYQGNIPFLLSGGIRSELEQEIKNIVHSRCIGLDINSGFEICSGEKDVQKIKKFIENMFTINV
ncbi:MAG: phosphoribosylanthranilate isomerase [Flavobacteriia bacterium]|nr:phosphoribosylanthranilate isomerase [Flavobacteriia bacterium]